MLEPTSYLSFSQSELPILISKHVGILYAKMIPCIMELDDRCASYCDRVNTRATPEAYPCPPYCVGGCWLGRASREQSRLGACIVN